MVLKPKVCKPLQYCKIRLQSYKTKNNGLHELCIRLEKAKTIKLQIKIPTSWKQEKTGRWVKPLPK